MKIAYGTFNGTGAAVYICVGFVPDYVKLFSPGDADFARAFWNRGLRASGISNGIREVGATGVTSGLTAGNGIIPYEGGDTVDSTAAYGEGTYLAEDKRNYRFDTSVGFATDPATWTLGSSANRTGNWGVAKVASGVVGVGSEVVIQEGASGANGGKIKRAFITAITSDGEQANEVTLSRAIATGTLLSVSGKYAYSPMTAGELTPAGFQVAATSVLNVNDELQCFECGCYENY